VDELKPELAAGIQTAGAIGNLLGGVGVLASGATLAFYGRWGSLVLGVAGMVAANVLAIFSSRLVSPDESRRASAAGSVVFYGVVVGWVVFVFWMAALREPVHALAVSFWAYGPATAWTQSRGLRQALLKGTTGFVAPALTVHLAWALGVAVLLLRG